MQDCLPATRGKVLPIKRQVRIIWHVVVAEGDRSDYADVDLALVGGLGVDVDEAQGEIFEHENGY